MSQKIDPCYACIDDSTLKMRASGEIYVNGPAIDELAYLDITTLGTGAASKAVVLDAGGDYIMPSTGLFGLSRGTLAASGSGANDAAVITQQVTAVTGANGTLAVALPAASVAIGPLLVINTVLTTGATLPVFPVNGGNDQINGGAEDAAFTMGPGKAAWFIPTSATQWYVEDASGITSTKAEASILTGVTASAAELNYNDITTLGTGAASKAVVLDAGEDYTWPATGILTYGVLKDPAGTALGATVAEINQACDQSTQVLTAGVGFAGVNTVYKTSIVKQGDIFKTTIIIDLTGTASSTTDLDIIGTSGVSHIGQITAAKNGTLFFGQITCLETPAGGINDIDVYTANEGTGAFDAGIAALTETAMLTKGGAWTAAAATPVAFAALPVANDYMYLTGGAGGTAGTYTAGQFMIELWGF